MKRLGRVLLVLVVALSLFSSNAIAINKENISPLVKRIGGENRILTSVKLSKEAFKKSDNAILVGSKGEIDALGGTLLANKLDAPIIMTDKDSLSSASKVELDRLGIKNVFILGGENAVSQKIVNSLKDYKVERIEGYNRVETAIEIAKNVVGEKTDEVFLSLGYDVYADALAIGPVAAKLNKPVLLSKKKSLPPLTIKAIEDFKVKKVTIIGGLEVVSKEIEDDLKSRGLLVDRVCGSNREETSIKIAQKYLKNPSEIILANGYVFADSVVGGYFAYRKDAPIILSKKDRLLDSTFNYISKTRKNVHVLGLFKAIEKNVETELNIILKTDSFKGKFFLLPKNNDYDFVEASKMVDRVMNISPRIIGNIYNARVRMKFCDGPITDEPEYRDLKGQVPRGWEGLGKTWDDVPGAGGTDTPIARIGYSKPGTKNGHNSCNLELHELAHTIDNYISGGYYGHGISDSHEFIKIWKNEVKKILPEDYYISYKEEYFAETFSLYYLNNTTNENLLKKAPRTHAFIKSLEKDYKKY